MGMFRERNIHFSHLVLWPILITVGFLPRLPQLIPKTVYPTVGLAFYLPLFDILPYLNKVRTALALAGAGLEGETMENRAKGCGDSPLEEIVH